MSITQSTNEPTIFLIGTAKGLVVFEKKLQHWSIQHVHFLGMPISMVYVDTVNEVWWVGISHYHWGQKLQFSKDKGNTWQTIMPPKYPANTSLHSEKKASLEKIWCIQQGGVSHPNRLWVGTEPGGLFVSEDYGQNFSLVQALWNHPSRTNPQQWFGTGRNSAYIHSIVVDPRDANHLFIAVSCAGIFETRDAGKNWSPKNKGLIAAYLPDPTAEVGHDPHLLLGCYDNPNILWQQNHCGIFRSTNNGNTWQDVSDKNGIAHYGFTISIDIHNANRAWVIPAISDTIRVAPALALAVYYTDNGGTTWQALREGLPQQHCFDIVFRHAFSRKGQTLVFGTTTGNLYISQNDGMTWVCIANNLARVNYIAFA